MPQQLFWGIILYLFWNLLWLTIMGMDKLKARKGRCRISERTLFTGAFCFGALGVLAGMFWFRHKTRHLSFMIGVPLLLLFNWGCLLYLHALCS